MKIRLLPTFAITVLLATCPLAAAPDSDNLIQNGSFELGQKKWEMAYKDKGTMQVVTPDEGSSFLRLFPTESAPPEPLAMQQQLGSIPTEGTYLFRAKLRINGEYSGKMPVVQLAFKSEKGDGTVASSSATLQMPAGSPPDEWVTVEKEFRMPGNLVYAWVVAFAYGTQGAADYDDVEILAAK